MPPNVAVELRQGILGQPLVRIVDDKCRNLRGTSVAEASEKDVIHAMKGPRLGNHSFFVQAAPGPTTTYGNQPWYWLAIRTRQINTL